MCTVTKHLTYRRSWYGNAYNKYPCVSLQLCMYMAAASKLCNEHCEMERGYLSIPCHLNYKQKTHVITVQFKTTLSYYLVQYFTFQTHLLSPFENLYL